MRRPPGMRRWRAQALNVLVIAPAASTLARALQLETFHVQADADAQEFSELHVFGGQEDLAAQLVAIGVHRDLQAKDVATSSASTASGLLGVKEDDPRAPLALNATSALLGTYANGTMAAGLLVHTDMRIPMPAHGLVATLLRQLAVPVAALMSGLALRCIMPKRAVLRYLLMFFGAQSFMNVYMKAILSDAVVSADLGMKGFQGPLILTALQQLVTFVCLWAIVGLSHFTPFPYKPRRLTKGSEVLTIVSLAICFSANIALNNFSLSLLDLSASVMIRSLSPMSALILQLVFSRWFDREALDMSPQKLLLMMGGVACALVAVMAKYHNASSVRSPHYALGLVLCASSVLASSMELIVVVIIGKGMKMNSMDTILYMSFPAFVMIFFPAIYLRHPVSYPYHMPSTDWEIFHEVWDLKYVTIVLVLLSGVFALFYNLLLYMTVRNLSPLYATFAGNFNKVAAIGFSLFLGFEKLPPAPWNAIMVLGVLGNMISFTGYSLWPRATPLKRRAPSKA